MSLHDVLMALDSIGHPSKRRGGEWVARCPVHGQGGRDSNPSFAVRETDGGKLLVYCQARCDTREIMAALNLPMSALMDSGAATSQIKTDGRRPVTKRYIAGGGLPPPPTQTGEPSCVMPIPEFGAPPVPERLLLMDGLPTSMRWSYRDAGGRLMHAVLRWDMPNGRKEIRPLSLWRGAVSGGLLWRHAAPPVPRPMYGLDRLADDEPAPVLVTEGEKAADAAAGLVPWCVCVGWHGGVAALPRIDWTPLQARRVVLWPDADDAGEVAMRRLRDMLMDAGARFVGVVTLPPEVSGGWDLADELPAGMDVTACVSDALATELGGDVLEDDSCFVEWSDDMDTARWQSALHDALHAQRFSMNRAAYVEGLSAAQCRAAYDEVTAATGG